MTRPGRSAPPLGQQTQRFALPPRNLRCSPWPIRLPTAVRIAPVSSSGPRATWTSFGSPGSAERWNARIVVVSSGGWDLGDTDCHRPYLFPYYILMALLDLPRVLDRRRSGGASDTHETRVDRRRQVLSGA